MKLTVLSILLAAFFALTACGMQGDLYLPKEDGSGLPDNESVEKMENNKGSLI